MTPHPYRSSPPSPAEDAVEERRDDYVLGAMLVGLDCWRVALALATGEPFGTEPTIAAIMTGLGVLLLAAARARR